MEERSVVSERGRTYYWIEKCVRPERENLVFLPGLTADHRLFDGQIQHFSGRHTVLTWDAPAHGKSRPYQDFSYGHLAEELQTILDREEIGTAVLIGQSAGGFVAQSLLACAPERVKGLITIGTCPYGSRYYSPSDLFWLKQTRWMFRLFPDRLLRASMARMCGRTRRGRENMLQMLQGYSKDELCRLMYLGFAGFIPEIRDTSPCGPIWLTAGEHDRTGKVRAYNEAWHRAEGHPLFLIPGAAHNANVDQPEAMNRIIDRFLRQLSEGAHSSDESERGRQKQWSSFHRS